MSDTSRHDHWALGSAYENYVGRWSRPVAEKFLTWIAVPPGRTWLDIGCGTGALTQRILDSQKPTRIVGIDPSANFVEHAAAHILDPRASFRVGDAQALAFGDSEFDAAVSGLVLNFVPDHAKAIVEAARVVRPNGIVAAYVWDYGGEMQLMRKFWDAAVALNPAARELDEGLRFPVCKTDALANLFAQTGLRGVTTQTIDVPTVFKNFEDYWSPFLGGQGPAPGYCMKLSEHDRAALRERLRVSLPQDTDGKIPMVARAFAVKGFAI